MMNVICAPPNGRNPGMATVDMGFTTVARGLGLGLDDVVYWRLFDQSEWIEAPGGSHQVDGDAWYDPDTDLTYRNLRGRIDDVLMSGPVVYWGDFHHLAAYHQSVASVLHRDLGVCATNDAARDLAATHLLLRGRTREDTSGVVSYGSTLLLNGPEDYAGDYGDDLRAFIALADEIHLRDGYSETVVRDIDDGSPGAWRGADCAFLTPPSKTEPREEMLSVFFGRSALLPEQLAWLGRRLTRALELEPRWIDWGREPAFWPMGNRRRFRLAWPALEHNALRIAGQQRMATYKQVFARDVGYLPAAQPSMSELLDQLASSALVLTDTYHLALNAWRVGTPAICVLDDPEGRWNVNSGSRGSHRDKRWDLYSNLDALPFTVAASRLKPGKAVRDETDRLAAVVRDGQLGKVIKARVTGTIIRAQSTACATVARIAGKHSP